MNSVGILGFLKSLGEGFFCGEYREEVWSLRKRIDELVEESSQLELEARKWKRRAERLEKDLGLVEARLGAWESIGVDPREEVGEKPEWLDASRRGYRPKREVVLSSGESVSVVFDPKDLYTVTPSIARIVAERGWRRLESIEERLKRVWAFVVTVLSYAYDHTEDWRPPYISLAMRRGDCEDGTILFLALARAAGVPAERVFNGLGYYYTSTDRFGHSFPIVRLDDGEWYVMETTLDSVPSRGPVRLLGSNYSVEWGAHNWAWDGVVREEYRRENGRWQF